MCQDLTMLAEGGAHRRIVMCEHGTIHLTWGSLTLQLQPDDLKALARYLVERREGAVEHPVATVMRLWIGQAGLALSCADVPCLVDLVERAVEALVGAMTPARARPERLWATTHPLQVDRRRHICN